MTANYFLRKERAQALFDKYIKEFDQDLGLVGKNIGSDGEPGTRVRGRAHAIQTNVQLAHLIYLLEKEEYYSLAEKILNAVFSAQDTDKTSPTFGLWPYFFEETLSEMTVIDFNWAEFISGPLIYIIKECRALISDEMAENLKNALRFAAECCIKRNVGLDYTNVICMGSYTLTAIGEILQDKRLFALGKKELTRFWEYTKHCGSFNEFNSPCYAKVAADAISKMLMHFEDEECIKMASDLNEYLWEMIAVSYSPLMNQFTPPFSRCYKDLEGSQTALFIYLATNGKYGNKELQGMWYFSLSALHCPEKLYPLFEKNGWSECTYYKKNTLRTPNEDVTIVQDLDSPDLIAYSYKTDKYLFGSFQKTDLWAQRRALMAVWNKDNKRGFKVCSSKDGKEFSSSMLYTAQYENAGIAVLGLTTDHGDFHYIVDPLKDGTVKAKKLSFKIKLIGEYGGLGFIKQGDMYVLSDNDIDIKIRVFKFVYNGKEAEVRIADDGLEFICFEDETAREITLSELDDTYAVLSFAIDKEPPNVSIALMDDRITARSDDEAFGIETFRKPAPYNDCIRNTNVKNKN